VPRKLLSPQEMSNLVQDLQEKLSLQDNELSFNNKLLKWVQGFMVAIVIVCFLAFIGFVIDAYKFHYDVKKEYQQNLEQLKQENTELKYENLKLQIGKDILSQEDTIQ